MDELLPFVFMSTRYFAVSFRRQAWSSITSTVKPKSKTRLQVKLAALEQKKERSSAVEEGRYLNIDEAASILGKSLSGSFFGRLQDVVTAPQELLTAVNAVLCTSIHCPSRSVLAGGRHHHNPTESFHRLNFRFLTNALTRRVAAP